MATYAYGYGYTLTRRARLQVTFTPISGRILCAGAGIKTPDGSVLRIGGL